MSKLIAIRVPDELASRIETRCTIQKQSATAVLLEAIERGWDAHGMSGERVNREPYRPAPPSTAKASLLESIPGLKTAGALDEPPVVPFTSTPAMQSVECRQCAYTEYDEQTGETHGCRLQAHSPKVKHQRGAALA